MIDETAPNLLTVPGIGYRLAGLLISEIGDASQFPRANKIIKFAGLDVRVYQSGTIEKQRRLEKENHLYLDMHYCKRRRESSYSLS